jgi:hypothetical protein
MTGIRTIDEQDIDPIRELVLQLAQDLNEEFQINHVQCEAHYQEMMQHGDMYQNFVYWGREAPAYPIVFPIMN